jgi:ribulose-5-phosphate 4-epimerase/fuculose-1-phosphate aldolase
MIEKYVGRKFETEFKGSEAPEDTRVYEIIQLGEKFKKMGLLPKEHGGFGGNMSFRNDKGFVVTAGGVDKGKLTPRNFVQVLNCNMDTKKVIAEGEMQPSSETLTHYLIYREKKAVNAVIHVHDSLVLEKAAKLKVRVTPNHHPYGTTELAYEIEKTLGHDKYIGVKGHGVLAAGKSLWEAGKLIETFHEAAKKS